MNLGAGIYVFDSSNFHVEDMEQAKIFLCASVFFYFLCIDGVYKVPHITPNITALCVLHGTLKNSVGLLGE